MEDVEVIERYIILLLGVVDRPLPSATHLQKEIFALSNANPKIKEVISYEKHNFGPYSEDISAVSSNPIFNPNAYEVRNKQYHITEHGQKIYNHILAEHQKNPRFKELLALMEMVRNLYDFLSVDEVLFLIYITYPDYTEKSQVSDKLLSSPRKEQLARSLLRKGSITEERYKELVN